MATAIVSTPLIEDLLYQVDPSIDDQPPAFSKALTSVLRGSINRLVKACRTPEALSDEIERQRKRVAIYRTTALAFELFVQYMETGD